MAKTCEDLGLTSTKQTAWWVKYQVEKSGSIDYATVYHHSDALYGALVVETSNYQFFKLDPQKSSYYSLPNDLERNKPFGKKVEVAFPSAVPEIIGACNCFALEQWAASVFHCMRVLETPLVVLAAKFSVPYERAEWHNIIEGIEAAVRKIDKNAGVNWKDEQKFFGEVARHLMFIKNSWRNHVMHLRDEYDEGKALSILQHTKELMIHIAERLSESEKQE